MSKGPKLPFCRFVEIHFFQKMSNKNFFSESASARFHQLTYSTTKSRFENEEFPNSAALEWWNGLTTEAVKPTAKDQREDTPSWAQISKGNKGTKIIEVPSEEILNSLVKKHKLF